MRVDELEAVLGALARVRPAAEVHLLGAELPEPGRRDALLRAPPAPGRARARARAAARRGQPLRAAALRRRAAAAALPARRRRLRHLPRHLLEDPLAGDPPRLGGRAAAGDGEDRPRQAGVRPLHLDPDPVLRPRVLRRGPLARLRRQPGRDLPRPPRRDARSAAASTSRRRRPGPTRRAGCSSGRPCPTTSTPATCWRRRCARTSPSSPGRPPTSTAAAHSSMRLNFSGVGEDEIREGIRRIGKVIGEQVELYETLTQVPTASSAPARSREPDIDAQSLPRSEADGRRRAPVPQDRRGARVKVAVLKGGRSLERGVSLRSGARVEDALERLGHEVLPLDVGADLVKRLADERPDARLRRPARARRRGRHRPGAAGDPRHPLHRPGVAACARCMDKVLAKHELREAGVPTPDWFAFNETAFRELGAADALGRDRGPARLPARRQAGPRQGRRWGSSSPPAARRSRRRWSPRSATTTGCCWSASSRAASSRSACSASEPLPIVEAIPHESDAYDFEARYEIGRTDFVCPAELDDEPRRRR